MKIILVRHAESAGDPFATPGRQAHGFLSESPGIEQAVKLRKYFEKEKIDVILCSNLGRAIQTAEIAVEKGCRNFVICDFLKEWMPNPELKTAPSTRFEEIMRQQRENFAEDTWKTELGEGAFDLMARICPPLLLELKKIGIHARYGGFVPSDEGRNLSVAIFAHGGSLNVILSFLLNLQPFPVSRFAFSLTGVAEIEFSEMNGVYYPRLNIPAPY